ncbi:growth hormone receptor a [Denticeps clupeoides]|uniref:Fibronectin type-III domain-containing protein n=1 Tax=Denticeps clupeoides TaxID=299321 RepID=A0AAY4AUR0_9TELE|nr:growth hormone receptor-like [Denticeps clupeoides]
MADRFPFLCLLHISMLLSGRGRSVSAFSLDDTEQDTERPHLTDCVSRDLETFNCWWTAGNFQNLSEPGALKLFYQMTSLSREWKECPHYLSLNECHFSRNYTKIWYPYCIELHSPEDNITYSHKCFSVENIVKPDPPVALNWTILNVSLSGLHFDILLNWEPPRSASTDIGWMSLSYQVQYRRRNASQWDMLDLESGTQQSVYGLRTDQEYEFRVRCKMRTYSKFGEFSNTILVHVHQIPSKETSFLVPLILIFGVVGLAILLILFSQQQRLMVILLPPVPAPKIKGIDPELFKKGNRDELNSILSSQHMYKPNMFPEDSWVEFIELDVDEAAEKGDGSDTQRLLGLRQLGSSHTLCIKDDDSGRASCYDPDLAADAEILLTATLLPPAHKDKASADPPLTTWSGLSSASPGIPLQIQPPAHTHPNHTPIWANMDFYAQVSDVTPTGTVVLSPGQPPSSMLERAEKEENKKNGIKQDRKDDYEENMKELLNFQMLVVSPDGGYTTESCARSLSSEISPNQGSCQTLVSPSVENQRDQGLFPSSAHAVEEYQSPHLLTKAPLSAQVMSDYTVVQEVDSQHSLLLNPTCPPLVQQPNPPKHLPTLTTMVPMTQGYLTPELLGNLNP